MNKPKKKKVGILAYALITIWFHDTKTGSQPHFVEYHQTTKQQAQDNFVACYPPPRFNLVDVKAKQQITII